VTYNATNRFYLQILHQFVDSGGALQYPTGSFDVLESACIMQGNIFFGNATLLAAEMEKLLLQPLNEDQVWFVILDFTLVVGIDSSAAETILKIFKLCRRCNVRLCYCAGAETGFPCAFPLSENIDALNAETVALKLGSCVRCGVSCAFFTEGRCIACGKKDNFTRPKWVCAASSLDSALRWCEDVILSEAQNGTRPGCVYGSCTHHLPLGADTGTNSGTNATLLTTASADAVVEPSPAVSPRTLARNNGGTFGRKGLPVTQDTATHGQHSHAHTEACLTPIGADIPVHLHQIYNLSRNEPRQRVKQLMAYFATDSVDAGTLLWAQGTPSDRAVLLVSGMLQHTLEEEANTMETVYPGHLVGEYGLLNQQLRSGERCTLMLFVVITSLLRGVRLRVCLPRSEAAAMSRIARLTMPAPSPVGCVRYAHVQ
jgi:hypothetical protein